MFVCFSTSNTVHHQCNFKPPLQTTQLAPVGAPTERGEENAARKFGQMVSLEQTSGEKHRQDSVITQTVYPVDSASMFNEHSKSILGKVLNIDNLILEQKNEIENIIWIL